MGMILEIAPLEEEHLDKAAELEKMCFSQPWSREMLESELGRPEACFLTASFGGELAGYAGMHCVCGECYVANVAVFPYFRRKGAGRALMEALVKGARDRGGEFISLEVRPSNLAAIALYRQLGFEDAGLRRGFYENPREDGLIMTLTLENAAE